MRRLTGFAAALTLVGVVLLPGSAANGLDAVPYTDPNMSGTITLCDTLGDVATHGNIHVKPFMWRAVGSTPPPAGYGGLGRTAALYGYQPIKDVDPLQWNGEYLTAGGRYTSHTRPMASATAADPSLADLLESYPPKWDGLIQLRMFLGAPQQATYTAPYDAATIRITGDTWTLVSGGHDGCTSGTAVSAELVLPSVAKLPTPAPNATTEVPAGSGRSTTPSPARAGANSVAPIGSAQPGPASSPSPAAVAATPSSDSGGSATPWVLGVLLVAAAGGVGLWWRLRTPGGRP